MRRRLRKRYGHARGLSAAQIGALTFALTEGEVGPGADAVCMKRRKRRAPVRAETVRGLVRAGLLSSKADGWGTLTVEGRAVAHRAYIADRGHEWSR